jgi:phosphoribosyl-ATP pyrophosphohydrolase
VLWADAGLDPAIVWEKLAQREGVSGLDEKKARKS